jgi:hypothetical protein
MVPVEVMGPPVRPVPVAIEVTPVPVVIEPQEPFAKPSKVAVVVLYRNAPFEPARWPVVPLGTVMAAVPGTTGLLANAIVGDPPIPFPVVTPI